jgi:hypothetical protein
MSQETKTILLPAIKGNKKPWISSYKTKPCKYFALNSCKYGSRCFFRHDKCIQKSQEWSDQKFKELEKKINEEFHKQLEHQKRLEKKIDKVVQYQIQLQKLVTEIILQFSRPHESDVRIHSQLSEGQESSNLNKQCIEEAKNPITLSAIHSLHEPECGHCKQPAKLRCTRCKKVYYCTQKHQAEHWKYHKQQCFQGEAKNENAYSSMTVRKEMMNMVQEFNIPVADADFDLLLKEIEDDELRKN